ncbi:MAG: hypothetical protein A2017_01335 [Lentisphaerae bacterium GWF2_44_16]|nr:MAG: hypothetical protein A2017_01335 [Lentisphaerae bacterium GWF2_44_16]
MINSIKEKLSKISSPANYYIGQKLPADFAIPDNILLFYHKWAYSKPQTHLRYTLIIAFASMTYYVDNVKFDIKPGNILFIYPHQYRYTDASSSVYERLFITFQLPSKQPYIPTSPLMEMTEYGWQLTAGIIDSYLAGDTLETALKLTLLMKKISRNPITYQQQNISSTTAMAIQYINNNLHNIFGNEAIAEHLKVSESNLRLIFRSEMGISLGRYISNLRLDAAKHRLLNTNMNIEATAHSCGYNSIYAFSHFFKKKMGLSPLQFRQTYRKYNITDEL